MKKYFKNIENGYITSIGTGSGMEEISQEEYEQILSVIRSAPAAEKGWHYRLRTDLTWEPAELPDEDEPDLPDEEALNIILGGEPA